MATHSCIFAWRIPWTEEPGRLQSIGLQRVRHDWRDLAHMHTGIEISEIKITLRETGCVCVCVWNRQVNAKFLCSVINVIIVRRPENSEITGRLGQGRQLHYMEHVTVLQQISRIWEFPGNPVDKTVLLLQSVGVLSLVREVRSYILHDAAKKIRV